MAWRDYVAAEHPDDTELEGDEVLRASGLRIRPCGYYNEPGLIRFRQHYPFEVDGIAYHCEPGSYQATDMFSVKDDTYRLDMSDAAAVMRYRRPATEKELAAWVRDGYHPDIH